MERSKRIAVCITGLFRHWDLCRSTILSIGEKMGEYEVDYFIATWDKANFDGTVDFTTPITSEHFTDDFNDHNLVNYAICPFGHLYGNGRSFSRDGTGGNEKHICLSMAYLKRQANLMKMQHEVENDFVYDYVIGVRPDIILVEDSYAFMRNFIEMDTVLCGDVNMTNMYKYHISSNHNVHSTFEQCYGLIMGDCMMMASSPSYDHYCNMYEIYYSYRDYNHIPVFGQSMDAFALDAVGLRNAEVMMLMHICRNDLRVYKDELQDPSWATLNADIVADREGVPEFK